ncbi:MAG: hypothetical protein HOO06_01300 [Bdellovibrionaceae bacterium]|jgi:hypothetical protein|nr:hypothetical protein [Pseudobdellovibrionaceae bacterium]
MFNVVRKILFVLLFLMGLQIVVGCTSSIPEITSLYPSKLNVSANALLLSDGSVTNSQFSKFTSDLSDPRNNCVMRSDREQIDGYDTYTIMTGLLADSHGSLPYNIDPRIVSASYKPDTLQLYGLMSYGLIVEIDQTGTPKFGGPCPFEAGCDGYVRFKSFSAGYGDRLFVLDEAGQLFEAGNLSNPLETFSPRISQVSYF